MITRYALFEGSVAQGQTEAFRAAVLDEILPVWKQFPGALSVRVTFGDSRDDGAPEFPLILAIDWKDMETIEAFLANPIRMQGRAATEAVMARFSPGGFTIMSRRRMSLICKSTERPGITEPGFGAC